jgi:hypothetical protein
MLQECRDSKYSWFDPLSWQVSAPDSPVLFCIVEFQKFRVLSIAGTKSWEDWAVNLDYGQVRAPDNAKIHQGKAKRSLFRWERGITFFFFPFFSLWEKDSSRE